MRRLLRLLLVTNPAALWLLLRRGPGTATSYLHQALTLYLWPDALAMRATSPTRLPEIPPEQLFPEADFTRIELLHPLIRTGGVRPEELAVLGCVTRALRPRRVVEIGTAEGRTTLNLALHAPDDAEILTFDLPPEAPDAAAAAGADYRQLGISEPGFLFRNHPLAAKIRPTRADSTRHDWSPLHGSVDLMFVDGDHAYAGVRSDSQTALRLLRPGGAVLWHDYGVAEGVTAYLNELAREHPVAWLSRTSLACLRREA